MQFAKNGDLSQTNNQQLAKKHKELVLDTLGMNQVTDLEEDFDSQGKRKFYSINQLKLRKQEDMMFCNNNNYEYEMDSNLDKPSKPETFQQIG